MRAMACFFHDSSGGVNVPQRCCHLHGAITGCDMPPHAKSTRWDAAAARKGPCPFLISGRWSPSLPSKSYEEGRVRTNRALRIIAEVATAFPKPILVTTNAITTTVIVGVEVVSSLELDPSFEFVQTFRRRGESGPLDCLPLPVPSCASPSSCHLQALHRAISSGACPNVACAVQLADVLSRPQQKLVDALLTADLIQFAACSTTWVAIASCDDDFWPGIRTAITFGNPIIHLQTKPGRRPSSTYAPTAALYSYRLY
jgi:hypothetical protein